MSVRRTIQIGHPSLKAPNSSITDFSGKQLKKLITDLRDTMRHNGLIGIAAPQIAQNYTVFVTEPRKTNTRTADQADIFRVYINPRIVSASKKQNIIYEGCGSVLHGTLFGPVQRSSLITVEAYDEKGKKFRLTCDGILARVIQHEYDHLQGVEFLEKVYDYKQLMTDKYYIQNIKNSPTNMKESTITTIHYQPIE